MNVEIGIRVRNARERLHMSRENLAEIIGVSTLFVGYIECGQKGMSIETLTSICKALHVSADYILLGHVSAAPGDDEVEQLLRDLPPEYLPLAADAIRTLLNAISVVQSKEKNVVQPPAAQKPMRIAARTGKSVTISVSQDMEQELAAELARLKMQGDPVYRGPATPKEKH